MIRKVLVTGGAGYIGSHLVDALVTRGYEVTVLDALEPQVHRSGTWPSYANPKVRYVRGDVTDRAAFAPLVLENDAVVHFAAAVSVGQSMYQVDRYVNVNTRGTGLLLDVMVNEKHHLEKIIVASSVGVYGEGAYWCDRCNAPSYPGLRPAEQLAARDWEPRCPACGQSARPVPTPEHKPLYRDNIYAMTKYHQEEMVLLMGKTYGIPAVAPRFFNVYGPRQSLSNPYAGVAAIFMSRLLNGKPPVVFEDGGQLRDFVSIHDVVDCLVLMLETPGADYLPVNIGSGTRISILEIAETLNRLLGTSIDTQVLNQGRGFDIRHCFADITRARETLGYEPKVTFEQGMSELIGWARTSPDGAVDMFEKALSELKEKGLVVDRPADGNVTRASAVAPSVAVPPAVAAAPALVAPSPPPPGLGTAQGLPANRWTWLAYGFAMVLTAWIAFFLVRMPFQMTDNIGNMLNLRHQSLWELTETNFGGGPFLRPFLWSTFKVVFDFATLVGGHYHVVFKSLHVAQIAALLLLVTRLFGVRTARDFLLATAALTVLVGSHTFSGFVIEAYPINSFLSIAICCVAALNLAESRGGRRVDVGALAALAYGMFTIESGLLVWVVLVAAWMAGSRGVSKTAITWSTAMVAGYFVLRFLVLDGSAPGLEERSTGYWTRSLDPEELQARFGENPLPLYVYNVVSSLLSLLFAEPRAGVWDTLRLRAAGEPLPPWLLVNLFTMASITLPLLVLTARRALDWVRLRVASEERAVFVFWALAAANAVMSYGYTKDQILTPAGCLFALAAYVTFRRLLAREASWPLALRPAIVVWLLLVSAGWTLRTFALSYQLNHSAYRQRDDWSEIEEWMAEQRVEQGHAGDADFVRRIANEALATQVPHPSFIYGRNARFFDQKN